MAKGKPSKSAKVGEKKANRRANGQFGPGNNCGTAPYSKADREWKRQAEEALRRAVPPDRLERIMKTMAAKAENGNVEAAKFVAERLLGKPAQQVNLGTESGDGVKLVVHLAKD